MTASNHSQPEQDYAAALHEIKSNLDVRRLMFVLSNVLIPALAIAIIDALTGSHFPASLEWLPLHILPVVGAILAIAGVLVTAILTRCHYGLVVNSNKMQQVLNGELQLAGLNWLGVTTNFVALTALYAGVGLSLFLASFGLSISAVLAGCALFLALMLFLRWNHRRANRLSQQLVVSWQTGAVAGHYQEQHVRESLDATTADVSVIVVMAVALFSGTFNCMTSLGSLAVGFAINPSLVTIKTWGIPVLSGFTLLALLLSGRMVVRLRIALAQHAQRLAELRNEQDTPWQFRLQERTFLLYVLLHLLTSASFLILSWSLWGRGMGITAGVVLFIVGILWYPWQLRKYSLKSSKQL